MNLPPSYLLRDPGKLGLHRDEISKISGLMSQSSSESVRGKQLVFFVSSEDRSLETGQLEMLEWNDRWTCVNLSKSL
jgi:hypothetical protein